MSTVQGKRALFFKLFCCCYAVVTICILYLFFWGSWQEHELKAGITTGIIIGSFFPFISFRYFYLNYLVDNHESKSVLGWIGPSLLLHMIIVFGFLITISTLTQKNNYTSPMFTGFYEYGKIYKSFQDKESQILKNPGAFITNGSQETGSQLSFNNLIIFYRAYFSDSQSLQPSNDPQKRSQTYAKLAHKMNNIPAAISLTFGFLGALIFCLMDALVRMNHSDLYPKTYISSLLSHN